MQFALWVYIAIGYIMQIPVPLALWVYNANCIVGTAHMLMTKPIALWLCIVAVSGNHDYSDSRVGERKIAALFLQCNPKNFPMIISSKRCNSVTKRHSTSAVQYIVAVSECGDPKTHMPLVTHLKSVCFVHFPVKRCTDHSLLKKPLLT